MKIIAICICLLLIMLCNNCVAQICPDPMFIIKAEVLKSQEKYSEAIAEYGKAIKLEPTNSEYYYRRGLTYIKMLNYVLAVEDFNTVIKLSPKYYQAYGVSACTYAMLQNTQQAMQKYNAMCEIENCPEEYKTQVKTKILSSLQKKELEKLTSQYTDYFLLFLKSF